MFTTKILNKTSVAKSMIVLEVEKPAEFTFTAGQFVQFHLSDSEGDFKRSYSIASAPKNNTLTFLIKLLPGGRASTYFAGDIEGDALTYSEAKGRFVLKDTLERPLLFVATGSGMAPCMSMIDTLIESHTDTPLTLLLGVRHEEDIFWHDRLSALAAAHPQFTYHLTLSQPTDDWNGLSGRVTDHITTDYAAADTFLCGSAPMVMEVRKMLIAAGAENSQVHFEVF